MKFITFPNFPVKKGVFFIAQSDENGIFEVDESNINFAYVQLMCEEYIEPVVIQEPTEVKQDIPLIDTHIEVMPLKDEVKQDKPIKILHCKQCGEEFTNMGLMLSHIRKDHKKVV
jgi:hypothetical protein